LLSYPKKAELVCSSLCQKIKKTLNKIDIILSPAIGGIVVGYEIGRQLEVETIFAERLDKKLKLRRGFSIPKNSRVLIVEDVITTGKSALECSDIVLQNKSKIAGYACIIDRTDNKSLINENIVSQLKFEIETFKVNELPEELKRIQAIKPGSRNLS
jgi:orotate phosphoribosyltransferase